MCFGYKVKRNDLSAVLLLQENFGRTPNPPEPKPVQSSPNDQEELFKILLRRRDALESWQKLPHSSVSAGGSAGQWLSPMLRTQRGFEAPSRTRSEPDSHSQVATCWFSVFWRAGCSNVIRGPVVLSDAVPEVDRTSRCSQYPNPVCFVSGTATGTGTDPHPVPIHVLYHYQSVSGTDPGLAPVPKQHPLPLPIRVRYLYQSASVSDPHMVPVLIQV